MKTAGLPPILPPMSLFPRTFAACLLGAALVAPATAGADGPPTPPVPGIVRLHIETPQPVQLSERQRVGDTKYGGYSITTYERVRPLCLSPCDTVIDARAGYRLTLASPEEDFPEPPEFQLKDRAGDVTVVVVPGSNAMKTGGRLLTVFGALGVLVGGVGVPLNYATGASHADPTFNAAAITMLVAGAAALGGGIPLLLNARTTLRFEPQARGLGLSLSM